MLNSHCSLFDDLPYNELSGSISVSNEILVLYFHHSLNNRTITVADTEKKQQALENLISEISQLKENWDGYDALKISPIIAKNTLLIVKIIKQFPELLDPIITPLANGTISVEWETNQGTAYLEVGNTRFSGYIKPNDQKQTLIEGQANSLNWYTLYWINSILFPENSCSPFLFF